MEQALARFEQYLNRRFGQTSTPKHYRSDLRIFIRTIGDRAPQDVTPADIDTFVDDQVDRGLSPTTINRRLACIRSFFEYLAAERPEHHWPNPVINRRHTLKTGSRLPRDASDEDVSKIFAALSDEQDRAMFGLMVGAGLRVGESCALQLDDIEEPISPDSLAKLRVRGKGGADFAAAMDRLESTLIRDRIANSKPLQPIPPGKPSTASPAQLEKLRRRMADSDLPSWLREVLDAYISWRWPTWRAQTAYRIAGNMMSTICRVWAWLAGNCQIEGWETFRRSDLEAWLQAQCQEGLSQRTIENNLGLVRMLLRFAETHGYDVDPGLFRVEPPKRRGVTLPRYLPEPEFRRLETTVLESTQADTYSACFDRAWFLVLAHTGCAFRSCWLWDLTTWTWQRNEPLCGAASPATTELYS